VKYSKEKKKDFSDIRPHLNKFLNCPEKNYRGADSLDLIIMNDASFVINFEIIKPNFPVFVRNEDLKRDIEQKIINV
jgi:hypothetical protein